MSYEAVKSYFKSVNMEHLVMELEKSSATVEEAAKAIGCEPKQIAKTMSFLQEDKPVLIVTAGDVKIDNKKYKAMFHQKAKMIPGELVESYIGHAPGGVCPFAVKPDVTVYLDISLKRFQKVYPAGGSGHSAVELSLAELEEYSHYTQWVDVCSGWMEESI
ncbi:MAG: YbaK/EbsC family protein [Bacillus sp. (in: Bacteria)]|nr:YbaK/EbsC family protein [Bacillus sp. (in: firmicutes)]